MIFFGVFCIKDIVGTNAFLNTIIKRQGKQTMIDREKLQNIDFRKTERKYAIEKMRQATFDDEDRYFLKIVLKGR